MEERFDYDGLLEVNEELREQNRVLREAAKREVDVWKEKAELRGKEACAQRAELERVSLLSSHNERRFEEVDKKYKGLHSLIKALPKVEGEIRLIHADDGDWHVVDLYDAIFTDKSWAVSYAALLQHRQGMEG